MCLPRNPEPQVFYQSPLPFDLNRIHAAAVYCSDGRFGNQVDDLLQNRLQLPRYDRLTIPGGPACFASELTAYTEESAALEQLRFLVKVHGLERVVLITHQDCAFYTQQLHVSLAELELRQRADMVKAIDRVRSSFSKLQVEAYFARKHPDGVIDFERLAGV